MIKQDVCRYSWVTKCGERCNRIGLDYTVSVVEMPSKAAIIGGESRQQILLESICTSLESSLGERTVEGESEKEVFTGLESLQLALHCISA